MRKVVLVTGSRADYGIMKRLICLIDEDPDIELNIIATGMHMEKKYGNTYREIENDGFSIFRKIPLNMQKANSKETVREVSYLSIKLSEIFSNKSFDLMIILGDRYEMLAAANVAVLYKIPICHLHGGEKTLGNYDEFIRNAITKMSHLHLTSTDRYRRRVIQMGENPKRVINTGALGVENVLREELKSIDQLNETLSVHLREKKYYVFLYHPITLEGSNKGIRIEKNLLRIMEKYDCVFIGSNSDEGSDEIMDLIKQNVHLNSNHYYFPSLSTLNYHSLVKHSRGLIGNSSSGLIEVPSLKVPTLNVGDRQEGRVRGSSVVDTSGEDFDELMRKFSLLSQIRKFVNPYEKDNSAMLAYAAIKHYLKNQIGLKKDFYDIDFKLTR